MLYEILDFMGNYYLESYVPWLRVCSYNFVGLTMKGDCFVGCVDVVVL